MTDPIHNSQPKFARAGGLFVGCVIYFALYQLQEPFRELYVLRGDDVSVIADGLLLVPSSSWLDWFTQGYSDFFDLYPDWPRHDADTHFSAQVRPFFQGTIYALSFAFGKNWSAYQLLACFAIAGVGALSFYIARSVLKLSVLTSLTAAALVVLSPPLWGHLTFLVAFAAEPLATIFVICAFLSVIYRRDVLCFLFLIVAILTKETTIWAPFAAAISILFRPWGNETTGVRLRRAAVMLLPFMLWLLLRLDLGSLGPTYVTHRYLNLETAFNHLVDKLTHLHYLFVLRRADMLPSDRGLALLAVDRTIAVILYALIAFWLFLFIISLAASIRAERNRSSLPALDFPALVTIWALTALAFLLVIPMNQDRFATSFVAFAWPSLLYEIESRGRRVLWLAVAFLLIVSLSKNTYALYARLNGLALQIEANPQPSMHSTLVQIPEEIDRVYVISAESLGYTNPKYIRAITGTSAEIVRVAMVIGRRCEEKDSVRIDRSVNAGTMTIDLVLPECAKFLIPTMRFDDDIADGHLKRQIGVEYDLPEIHPAKKNEQVEYQWSLGRASRFSLGRRMTLNIPADKSTRVIIEAPRPGMITSFAAGSSNRSERGP